MYSEMENIKLYQTSLVISHYTFTNIDQYFTIYRNVAKIYENHLNLPITAVI